MAFNLGDIFVTFKAKTDDLQTGVSKVKSMTAEAERTVNTTSFKQFSSNAATAFGGVADSIQGVITKAAIFATTSSVGIGTFVKSAADLQQTSKSFEVLTGNVDTANKLFAQLARYANTTPFEFPQIAKAGQILLGFGIQSDQVYSRIQMLGDIAAATGADFTSLALVFGQVNATGRLMGQDALQLINNKIPITSILAKDLGISVQEVKQRMEEGTISTDMFNAALEKTTKQGGFAFHGTDVLAQSLNGRLSTLKDTVLEVGRNMLGVKVDPELGLTVKPGGLFDRLSNMVPKIGESLQSVGPKLAGAFQWLFDHGEFVKQVLVGVAAAFVAAKLAAIGFAIAAVVNPVTLIATAIVALIGLLAALEVRFHFVEAAMKVIGPLVSGIWSALKMLLTGDFTGSKSFFGIQEDSPIVTTLITIHKLLSAVAGFVGNQLKGAFEAIGSIIGQAAKAMAPIINVFKEILANKAVQTVLKVIGVALLALAAAPVVAFFALFIGTLTVLSKILQFVADHFIVVKVAIGILMIPLLPLIALIAGLVVVFRNAGDIAKWFGDRFTDMGKIIGGVLSAIGGFFTGLFDIVKNVMTAIWNFISPVLEVIKNLFIIVFGGILLVILTAVEGWKNIIMAGWNFIYGFISNILGMIWSLVSSVWNAVYNTISGVLGAIWGAITSVWNAIYGFMAGIVNAVWGVVSGVWNAIYGTLSGILGAIYSRIVGMWQSAYGAVQGIMNGLYGGISGAFNQVVGFIGGIAGRVKNAIGDTYHWLMEAGKWVIYGFKDGMMSVINAIKDAAGNIGNAVKNKVKSILGIGSPSKVFKEYGEFLMQGMANGINGTMDLVTSAVENLAGVAINPQVNPVLNNLAGSLSVPVAGTAGGGSAGGQAAAQVLGGPKVEIHGDVNIDSQQDADYFWSRLDRDVQLENMGVSPSGPSNS